MIKAIIFDCFGVLATEAWLPFKAKFFGEDSDLYEQASDIAKQANQGLISHGDFIAGAAKLAGISESETRAFISRNVPDEALFEHLKVLKKSYKLGFLSNIAEDYLREIFSDEQLSLFDVIELSYKTGFIKPQVESYNIIAKKLGVDVADILMVDDMERNITGAKEAGMQAILYQNPEQFKKDLEILRKS